jgi:ABC-type uncharacterized transport system permease subunit
MVKAGDFDRILLRPCSTVLQLLGQELTLRRVGRLDCGSQPGHPVHWACSTIQELP